MAINFVTFSQDQKRLAVAKTRGFRIFQTDPNPKFDLSRKEEDNEEDNVSIIELMYSTQLAALVISPRRLIIKHTIVGLHYPLAVMAAANCPPESIHHLRIHIPISYSRGTSEQEAPSCRAGGGDVYIRHSAHEPGIHHRNLAKSECDMRPVCQ